MKEFPEHARLLIDRVGESPPLQAVQEQIARGGTADVSGLVGAGRSALACALAQRTSRLVVWITDDGDAFENAQADLRTLLGPRGLSYPTRDTRPYQWTVPTAELVAERLGALAALLDGACPGQVLLVPMSALFDSTLPPEALRRRRISLVTDLATDRDELLESLHELGYLRTDVVEEVGQFAVRGGIVDLFATSLDRPLRVEFFGDRVESLRKFDVGTQRTVEVIRQAEIWPQRETLADVTDLDTWVSTLSRAGQEHVDLHRDPAAEPPGLEWLFSVLGTDVASLCDYLPADALYLVSEPELLVQRESELRVGLERAYDRLQTRISETPTPERVVPDARPLAARWEGSNTVYERQLGRGRGVNFNMKSHPPVHGNLPLVKQLALETPTVALWGPSRGQLQHTWSLLDEPERLHLCRGSLVEGFSFEAGGLVCLTEHELFARRPRPRLARRFREGVAVSSYAALKPGDYVVHVDYGVGRYRGLQSLPIDGRDADLLEIRYAGDDKVFVPVEAFNRVRKFAARDSEPQLARIGSGNWERVKERTRRKILEMAEELVRLYAARKSRPGFAFGPDDEWLRQLEDSFPYDETHDQATALRAIKEDMHSAAPMDRLVGGDVGFGKTELAIRAALKAIGAGKQVAVLVPTTILAQQHLETFTERLGPFPVRVEMMSRFKSAAEQKAVAADVQAGRIDVVVGTHRLLSSDVAFRDLGLLVVDEEHRFGVRHKERIKQLRQLVDCLTLTATPIPRTLQMSLLGARDLSVINTPPQGRLPVYTEIVPFEDEVIRNAVLREIDRGGQVFFVHNRVQSIGSVYRYLKGLFGSLDIVIAHGQMKESELERVMLEFSHRRHQVLLSTAIIESGLDIPQANTIIINRAHTFGLAQLYQLRGRVGRSRRQAYAYLMVPPAGAMTSQARRRLAAVEQHSDLGSGFHLAMRDLEIRGAGNLLGAQQHGFIEAVGFELYTRLVEEAVAEVRGEAVERPPAVQFDTDRPLRLPRDYVRQPELRVDIYQRLADTQSPEAVDSLRAEVEDRFGRLPDPAGDLFDAAVCRLIWGRMGVVRARLTGGQARWEWGAEHAPDRDTIERLAEGLQEPHRYSWGKTLVMTADWGDEAPIARTRKLLQEFWNTP